MAARLTDDQMDQLETWIGTCPKTFTLLYTLSRDGCDVATFHNKCDNQGQTVTVLYNTSNTVFGGYTCVSWDSSGGWRSDNSAFLFRLQYNGDATKRTKFPVRPNNTLAMLCSPAYGPIFGSGHDLHTFSTTIQNTGGQFKLNGSTTLNGSYDAHGLTANDFSNENLVVTDLEVYRVTDGARPKVAASHGAVGGVTGTPWRKTPAWDEPLLESLMEEVISYKPVEGLHVKDARILLLGPVGAGKSSFVNTIQSVFKGRIAQKGCSGSAEHSVTTTYRQYQLRCGSGSGALVNVRLCDTRGIEEAYGIGAIEMNYLLDGNVPDWYQFNPSTPISPDTQGFIRNPGTGDKVHCVAFVIDASTVEVTPEKVIENLKQAQTLMNQKGITQVVLLTKVDRVCEDVNGDVTKVFRSSVVEDLVEKVSQILGVPRVLPIYNYRNELELDRAVSILAMFALRQMVNFADDYLETCLEKVQAEGGKPMKD